MRDFRIAITDCDHADTLMEQSVLDPSGFSWKLFQCKTEDDLIAQCAGYNAFINQYAPITEKVMASLPELKLVVRYGVGVNNVDLEAATRHGVQVCNVPDYGMNEVADQAMALTLCLTRKVNQMNHLVKGGEWNYTKAIPIHRYSARTVGIVGLGRIGKEYAKRAHAFGFTIIACDEWAKDVPDYVKLVSFEELIRTADIISLHCPADNNIDLIGEQELAAMKDGSYLINVSRGGIINEAALDAALASGKLAGAALDVGTVEPIPQDSPLLRHENLLVTPHMAWYSEEAAQELKRKVAEESLRFARGEAVHYPVNKL